MGLIMDFDFIWAFIGISIYLLYLLFLKLTNQQLPSRPLFKGIFILYLLIMFMYTFLPLPIGKRMVEVFRLMYGNSGRMYINLIPFSNIYDSLIGEQSFQGLMGMVIEMGKNIVLFIPFGFLYNFTFEEQNAQIVLRGFLLSLFIELTQLIISYCWIHAPVRFFDINDLLMNTLGVMIGYLLYLFIMVLEKKLNR